MNCDKVKDVVITDYVDNELDAKTRGEIERHLDACPECRELSDIILSKISGPLKNAQFAVPSEAVWYKVRSGIEKLDEDYNLSGIATIISAFLPRWANIAALAAIIVFTSFAGNYLAHNIWVKNSRQAVAAADETNDSLALGELGDIPSEQVQKVYSNIIGG